MITITFGAILLVAMTIALVNWRHGWLAAVVCGVLQDPARKLTPGTPAALTMSVVAVYIIILLAAIGPLQRNRQDFSRRFPRIYSALLIFLFFLSLAAVNGLMTFGFANWKVPALSLLIYCIPIPAVLLGYAWLQKEEQLITFFVFYSVLTAVALIGTPLEYLKVQSPVLGLVGMPESYIRHLPGIQIRVLSGIYRAPDIMGWHAATLTIIGIAMTLRARSLQRAWPWILAAAWGFFNCFISGRRKAIYMVAIFGVALLWRFYRRLSTAQVVSIILIGIALLGVVYKLEESEESSVYARGAKTTSEEVFERLEGGLTGTLEQFGINGAGLGAATQGVRHLTGGEVDYGWQEGGLGKLAAELGVAGMIAALFVGVALFRSMMAITRVGDIEGTSQIVRVALFGIVVANIGNFLVSAQAYSDPVLTLATAFFLGCLLATATLDEKLAAEKAREASQQMTLAPAAS